MPLSRLLFLGAQLFGFSPLVELVMLDGADGADLGIAATELTLRVEDGVDMQARRLRPASEFAESENQFLLQIIGEIVLRTEEDNTSLGDYRQGGVSGKRWHRLPRGVLEPTGNSEVPKEFVRVGCVKEFYKVCLWELAADGGCNIE